MHIYPSRKGPCPPTRVHQNAAAKNEIIGNPLPITTSFTDFNSWYAPVIITSLLIIIISSPSSPFAWLGRTILCFSNKHALKDKSPGVKIMYEVLPRNR